jgi:hypothetical protein
MHSEPQKSKSYGALVILGIVVVLAWRVHSATPAKPSNVTLPQNTAIALRLDQAISSRSSSAGQHFGGKLSEPLTVNGGLVLPAGTQFSGTVGQVAPAGKLAGGAMLRIVLTSFNFRGREYKVQAPPIVRVTQGQGKRTAKIAGGGAIVGGLVGAIAHGSKGALIGVAAGAGAGAIGAAATNKVQDVVLPENSIVTFRLSEPVTVALIPRSPARRFWFFS